MVFYKEFASSPEQLFMLLKNNAILQWFLPDVHVGSFSLKMDQTVVDQTFAY